MATATGLVHRANGGVLIISRRTLLSQPLLWMRLKTIATQQRFDWVGYDESRPLPVSVPSMPLSLTVVLTGDRESLADFQEMEPELAELAVYSEYEDNIQVADADDMAQWCQWVLAVAGTLCIANACRRRVAGFDPRSGSLYRW